MAGRAFLGGLRRRLRRQGIDERAVVLAGERLAGLDRFDKLAETIDHGEDGADQLGVGRAGAGADGGERVLGGVAERPDPRQVEEAAVSLDGVDEAEDLVEPGAIVGHGLPGDDLPRERLQHLPRLRDEIVDEIVHNAPPKLSDRA